MSDESTKADPNESESTDQKIKGFFLDINKECKLIYWTIF